MSKFKKGDVFISAGQMKPRNVTLTILSDINEYNQYKCEWKDGNRSWIYRVHESSIQNDLNNNWLQKANSVMIRKRLGII